MKRVRFIRGLGFLEALSLGVGFIVGSGIFIIPLLAAKEAGTVSLLSWLIGGIFSILTGLCFSELAARLPKAGGPYTYAHEAFGTFVGFIAGWIFWAAYLMMIAGETSAISLYLNSIFPNLTTIYSLTASSIIMLILTYINYRGVKFGGKTEDILTVAKLISLVIFALFGFFFLKKTNFFPIVPAGKTFLPILTSSTILILWAYLGAEIITVPEEEIQKAKKTVPKAIMQSILITNILYMLIAFIVIGMGIGDFKTISGLGKFYMGNIVGSVLILGGLISIIGALNAVILADCRVAVAMARDRLLPLHLEHLHKKYKTPDYALILQTMLALIAVFALKDFQVIAKLSVLLVLLAYLSSCLAVFKVIKNARGHFLLFESRVIPFLAMVSCIVLLISFPKSSWMEAALIVILGLIAYALKRGLKKW